MKRLGGFLLPVLLCLIVVVSLLAAFLPAMHSSVNTPADMQVMTAAPVAAPMPVMSQVQANTQQPNQFYAIVGGLILLTAMASLAFRKHLIQWRISALRFTASLKAHDTGSLAAGDQLKFPIAAGC